MSIVQGVMAYARHYVEVMDWPIFVLGRDKTTLPNCTVCRVARSDHSREECACLTCHGFYAATKDLALVERMVMIGLASGGGSLALRTGWASGVTVIDAEVGGDVVDDGAGGQLITGLEVLDAWEQWAGEDVDLLPTLRARTASGGLHLLYLTGDQPVKSRNRVLPGVDVKADGGYVALPCGLDARHWLVGAEWGGGPTTPMPPGAGMWKWLREARGGRVSPIALKMRPNAVAGRPGVWSGGYDYDRAYREGARGGERDVFFRDLIFRLRMQGLARESLEREVRVHWLRCQQVETGAQWDMPWEHLKYKIEHAWRNVQPDTRADWRRAAVQRIMGRRELSGESGSVPSGEPSREQPRRIMRLGESVGESGR